MKDNHFVKAHVIKNKSIKKNPLKKKWFKLKLKEVKKPFKKYNIEFTYFNCGKPSHIARDCHNKKTVGISKDKGKPIIELEKTIVMITKLNLVGEEVEWWIKKCITLHIYNDMNMFNS